ncbi:MAG TPA: PD-(D/E)XK nuclease family protein [Burkholderiales bacterium]|nr:PD-(D/E)XK nuclease family protein [Burkholderiales bacterium]
MAEGAQFPGIGKHDLLSRLAQDDAARVTVVTPNRRLARELEREFGEVQQRRGLAAWHTPDILPFGAFVARLYEDALHSDAATRLPLLLAPEQEWELWQSVIRASEWGGALLALASTAEECRRAWELVHEWDIAGALGSVPGNEDAAAFAKWADAYAKRCERERCTDAARLPGLVADLLGQAALARPSLVVAYGYDVVPPQAAGFLDACGRHGIEVRGCAPRARQGRAVRLAYASAREELEAAAQWARAKIESGAARVGVVVPELGLRRKEVARVFARVMHPAHNLPGAPRKAPPYNISLGAPLSEYALVRAALALLELASAEVPFDLASKLVRSPFLGGAESEFAARARLDAALRKKAPPLLTLGKLVGMVEGAPQLRARLESVFALVRERGDGERSPHAWGRHFSGVLAAAGFPGERGLDSDEFQTLAKFNEALAGFARLERVAPKMPVARALARLRHVCSQLLFQPETPDAPIQVLGILESAGLEFDALRVSGLTDEAWPLPARLNPFVPPLLQHRAGIPEASAVAALARGVRMTQDWLRAADEVVFSHPAMEQDRRLIVSPLVIDVPLGTPPADAGETWQGRIHAAARMEMSADGQASALPTRTPQGGTRILADQAACPFRAFARHRLGAEALEEPVAGPDPRTRGQLLHALMRSLWEELKGSDALAGDCAPAVARAAQGAVAQARIEEPFAALERARLEKLAREWLELERTRPPFEVVAAERKLGLAVAGLELSGRIDRLDRLASGGHALIDYKTGRPTPNDWMGRRPADPQLPLYALNAQERITAVAYARLRTGDMTYMGFSEAVDAIPGVKAAKDWEALVAGWKQEVESLGAGFASGAAGVDPKQGLKTCARCDLHPFCRVYERVDVLEEGDDE